MTPTQITMEKMREEWTAPLQKTLSYLQQENSVLHERVRKLEEEANEQFRKLEMTLFRIRAVAIGEQKDPSGLHLTAFSLIQKYVTEALGDEGME